MKPPLPLQMAYTAPHSLWPQGSTDSMSLLDPPFLPSVFSDKPIITSLPSTTLGSRQQPDTDILWTSFDSSYTSPSTDEAHNLSSIR